MGISDVIARMAAGAMRNARKIPLTTMRGAGYDPTVVQRPVIGVGNAPQYFLDAQQIGFGSIAGGGTIAGNAPAPAATILDWSTHTFGSPTFRGTLTQSREFTPLAAQQVGLGLGERR